jgi:hypothetical protein
MTTTEYEYQKRGTPQIYVSTWGDTNISMSYPDSPQKTYTKRKSYYKFIWDETEEHLDSTIGLQWAKSRLWETFLDTYPVSSKNK